MQQNKRLSTSKGERWELLHSLWIGWTFVLYLGWVAFFYIGLRARQRKWVLWSLLYSVPLILELLTSFTDLWPAANEYTWQGYLEAASIGSASTTCKAGTDVPSFGEFSKLPE